MGDKAVNKSIHWFSEKLAPHEDNTACNYGRAASHNPTPTHQHEDGRWWFYDEIWGDERGPYPNQDDAMKACNEYAKSL